MMTLDTLDKKLLMLLQKDSKQTTKQLSLHLNLSATAVYERIKKLEKAKVIKHYVALLDKHKVEKSFQVFCHIKLLKHSLEYLEHFENEILNLDEVAECFHISGDYDYILKIYVKDIEAYREFMVTKLTTIEYIGSTHSTFTISKVKDETKVVLN